MLRKLALKKLKGSDLSFFKSYLSEHPQTKQKAFNLDTKIIEENFFPAIKKQLEPREKKSAHVDLILFGPGGEPAYSLARKIKIDAKNLRLNGELIHDPDDQPGRFDDLQPGDFALFEFGGFTLPETVKIVLISARKHADATLHAECVKKLPLDTDSMCVLLDSDLQAIINAASPAPHHPICDWLDPTLLEQLGAGDTNAVLTVIKRRPSRGISAVDLKAAKESAVRTGELGEELLNGFFDAGSISNLASHKWMSQENAISPYDFMLTMKGGEIRHADAKSTSGDFGAPIYLSMAEIRHAVNSDVPYDIYRLYNVKESGAQLRIARDIKARLIPLLDSLTGVPDGVSVDSLSFKPDFFDFSANVEAIAGDDA